MENKDNIDIKTISQIKDFFTEIDLKLNQKEENSNYEIKEYFLINNAWLEKYFSISKKENIFNEVIYFVLEKMSLTPPKHIYNYNQNNFTYIDNIKIIPKNILSYFLSIKKGKRNEESNKDNNDYNLSKIIFKSSKIIIILEDELSLEILNKNTVPEYLICFDKSQNININQMINIFINEMKLNIPENSRTNIVYEYEMNNRIKLTIINLEKILEEQKIEKNNLSKDNSNKMNILWENKYKNKIDNHLNEIANKYNNDFQNQINLNNEYLKENLKNQKIEQNKIFEEKYNNIINKINDSIINNKKENNSFEIKTFNNNENKISLILDDYIKENDNDNNKKNSISEDFCIINDEKDINQFNSNSKKPLSKEKINLMIAPVLFFLSQIKSLIDYLPEIKESIDLFKVIEENLISEIIINFFEDLKEEKNENKKEIYNKYSDLILNLLSVKLKDKLKQINSPGYILSFILENLDIEEEFKSSQSINEGQSTLDLLKNKEYDIYNENEMFQMFIHNNTINKKTFIFRNFYNIFKSSKLCKSCNKRSYEYQSFPSLDIFLNKSESIVNKFDSDYEMYNTLLCKICFPENITQLLSPSYLKKRVEYCKNCDKYNEIIFNKYIFALKEFLVINIDRENDPKNEMIFIYPEILDLKNESKYIINLYQLTGVICKKINEHNYNINEIDNDISHYICYMKKQNEDKWITFDENYNIYECENKKNIFNFKSVSVLLYSKIEDK